MESKKLLVKNIPGGKIEVNISAKPTAYLFLFMIVGSLMIFTASSVYQLFGLVLVFISGYAIIFLPERKIMTFYKNYLIIFNEIDKDYCNLIYYNEILSYRYVKGLKFDMLIIELSDNRVYELQCFDKNKVLAFMKEYAKDKEIINNSKLLGH